MEHELLGFSFSHATPIRYIRSIQVESLSRWNGPLPNVARSQVRLLGILFATAVVIAIIMGNAYFYFRSNPNVLPSSVSGAADFPTGLVSTIFSPDPTVLSGSQTFAQWLLWFAIPVVFLFLIFLGTSLGVENRDIGLDSILYGLMLFVIPIGSNAFSLLAGQDAAGPLTVSFTSIGLVLGFSMLRVGRWVGSGAPKLVGREFFLIVTNLAIIGGLILAAMVGPVAFFNANPTSVIGWAGPLFCYLLGAVAPIWSHSVRELGAF